MYPATGKITGVKFLSSRWDLLEALHDADSREYRDIVNELILLYWKPVHGYIRGRGHREDAAELTQEFFIHCLRRDVWRKSNRTKGKFRSFLLASLKHFLIDQYHRREADRNRFVSLEERIDKGLENDLAVEGDAERRFHRDWCRELIRRTWEQLETEFLAAGREVHLALFRRQLYEPFLEGKAIPKLSGLAAEFGLDSKEASNRILTVKRAFRRHLREEIARWTKNDAETEEELDGVIARLAHKR